MLLVGHIRLPTPTHQEYGKLVICCKKSPIFVGNIEVHVVQWKRRQFELHRLVVLPAACSLAAATSATDFRLIILLRQECRDRALRMIVERNVTLTYFTSPWSEKMCLLVDVPLCYLNNSNLQRRTTECKPVVPTPGYGMVNVCLKSLAC